MLLVIDVGNTQTVMGVYDGEKLLVDWRLSTDISRSGDEFWVILRNLFRETDLDTDMIDGICVSSVVPQLQVVLEDVCDRYFKTRPIVVGPGVKTGLSILYDNPKEVGADRIVNSVAGIELYGYPLVLVDFGTATTFDAVSEKAEYLGGAPETGPGHDMVVLTPPDPPIPLGQRHLQPTARRGPLPEHFQDGLFGGGAHPPGKEAAPAAKEEIDPLLNIGMPMELVFLTFGKRGFPKSDSCRKQAVYIFGSLGNFLCLFEYQHLVCHLL